MHDVAPNGAYFPVGHPVHAAAAMAQTAPWVAQVGGTMSALLNVPAAHEISVHVPAVVVVAVPTQVYPAGARHIAHA